MSYNASSIQVLKGLEPVQKRPGMYTDTRNPNHLAMEVIDNSLDEVLAGYASEISVTLHDDGSISVQDNGRGMPVDLHPEYGRSGVELIMTQLHSGAKFAQDTYQFSGGLHGVGVSVVNALSAWLVVEVCRGGSRYVGRFEDGAVVAPLVASGSVPKRTTGTCVRFLPRANYFEDPAFDVAQLKMALQSKAMLCSQVVIHWSWDEERVTWAYPEGLKGYLMNAMTRSEDVLIPEVFYAEDLQSQQGMQWGMWWHRHKIGHVRSYVNLIPTPQGGSHLLGFRQGALDAVRAYIERHLTMPKQLKLKTEDVCDGMDVIVSYKVSDPLFAGQTKERLAMPSAQAYVSQLVHDRLTVWFHQNRHHADVIAQAAIDLAQQRSRAQDKVARKTVTSGLSLPGKLSDCISKDRQRSELFLVEGDSAGGSCKQARDREFQAVLPLRGKILNTWEVDSKAILSSQEVKDISTAIGVSPGSHDLSQLRYGRICLLADADSDGAHISTLLCALFVRHFPTLVQMGHVFVAVPPLYRIDCGKEVHYARHDAERDRLLQALGPKRCSVQRFKGLGEMNPAQLRETTMHPKKRSLIQLLWDPDESVDEAMGRLLGKKEARARRHWLESYRHADWEAH